MNMGWRAGSVTRNVSRSLGHQTDLRLDQLGREADVWDKDRSMWGHEGHLGDKARRLDLTFPLKLCITSVPGSEPPFNIEDLEITI